jgi:ankyrin repeat protein
MPPPKIPLELLITVAHHLIDNDDSDNDYGIPDLKSFRQVNRALYECLNTSYLRQLLAKHNRLTDYVLKRAIQTNDTARLKFFLEEVGVDVEAGYISSSPLSVAVNLDKVPMARLLLENGAQFQENWFSAMHSATSAEMVQLLLEFNADPNRKDGKDDLDKTPLHRYVYRGNIEAMRAVLQHGVEVNSFSTGMTVPGLRTPLHEAARYSADAVSVLLEFGADAERKDNQLNTPLHLAAKVGKTEAGRILMERWPEGIREKNEDLNTPLHLALLKGQTATVELLVERWPEGVREKNIDLNTPLHLAAAARKIDVVRLLLERWSEGVREKNKDSNTPLHLAAEEGRLKVVKMLFECWPEGIREKNNNLDTPMHLAGAVRHRNMTDVLDFLAKQWPEGLRMKNKYGRTPKSM